MANARLMQQTLAQFDIEVALGDITKGPTITRYELHPAPGTSSWRKSSACGVGQADKLQGGQGALIALGVAHAEDAQVRVEELVSGEALGERVVLALAHHAAKPLGLIRPNPKARFACWASPRTIPRGFAAWWATAPSTTRSPRASPDTSSSTRTCASSASATPSAMSAPWPPCSLSACPTPQADNFLQLDARGGVKFVTGDGRPLGDVAQGDFDVELGEGLLHEAGIGHEFVFGLGGLGGGIGVLEEIERGQGVIADFGGGGDGDEPGFAGSGPGFGGGRGGTLLGGGIGLGHGLLFLVIEGWGGWIGQDVRGGGGGKFLGGDGRDFIRRGGFLGGLGRLFFGTLAGVGLRDAQIADGGFGHGAEVGAQSAGFGGFR